MAISYENWKSMVTDAINDPINISAMVRIGTIPIPIAIVKYSVEAGGNPAKRHFFIHRLVRPP